MNSNIFSFIVSVSFLSLTLASSGLFAQEKKVYNQLDKEYAAYVIEDTSQVVYSKDDVVFKNKTWGTARLKSTGEKLNGIVRYSSTSSFKGAKIGICEDLYKNGERIQICEWYENGRIRTIYNDKINRTWFPSGNLAEGTIYKSGKERIDLSKLEDYVTHRFYKDNELVWEKKWDHGRVEIVDSNIIIYNEYKNGKLHGNCYEIDHDYNPYEEEDRWGRKEKRRSVYKKTYRDGNPVRYIIETYNNNVLIIYEKGFYDGLVEKGHNKGKPKSFLSFEKQWYNNGQLKKEVNYKNGTRVGLSREWYENGNIKEEGKYKNGYKDGQHDFWHDNGQLYSRRYFKSAKKVNVWKFWDSNGHLTHEESYKKGTLIYKKCWAEGTEINCK